MAGRKGGFELLVVGWTTHSLVVDDPPNDPQYGVECLARVDIERFGGHQSVTEGDGLVFKAMVACQTIVQIFMANVFPFYFCANFHICLRIFALFV